MRSGRAAGAAVLLGGLVVAGCSPDPGGPGAAGPDAADRSAVGGPPVDGGPAEQVAELVLQVTEVHEETGMTLLEGPVFDPDGALVLVDVTAPAGEPRVLRVDLETEEVTPVVTDTSGVYTSAQISPLDGRLYLTDFLAGEVDSVELDGSDLRTVFAGPVDGTPMQPDDLAFDPEGAMYVSDTTGFDDVLGPPRGRVVRIAPDGSSAAVLAAGLPAPNGISFDADSGGLWVSGYAANRIDHLSLAPGGTAVTSAHPGMHVDAGTARVDSNAVDAAGNVYQGHHDQARITVHAPTGELLARIDAPVEGEGPSSATNVAIRPGTTEAHMTVSGPEGGFVYSFEALAEGTRQSNGG